MMGGARTRSPDRVDRAQGCEVGPLATRLAARYVGPAPLPPVAIITATGRKLGRFALDQVMEPVADIPDTSSMTRVWEFAGTPVATLVHGVGGPSTDRLLLTALMQGVRAFVRIGTCGLLGPGATIGTVVVAGQATGDDTSFQWYWRALRQRDGLVGRRRQVEASPVLTAAAERSLRHSNARAEVGRVYSTSLIFREGVDAARRYQRLGCVAADMETATVLACAQWYAIPAVSVLVGRDHITEGGFHNDQPEPFQAGIKAVQGVLAEVIPLARRAAATVAAEG
jgi:uridine phosphorylase